MIRLLYILLIAAISVFGCKRAEISSGHLAINLDLSGFGYTNDCTYDSIIPVVFTKIEIRNAGDSVLKPWIMNCSWQDHLIIEPEKYHFCLIGCDRNRLEEFELQPGQSIVFNGLLSSSYGEFSFDDSIRVGFIQLFGNRNDIDFRHHSYDTLWNRMELRNPHIWSRYYDLTNVNNTFIIK